MKNNSVNTRFFNFRLFIEALKRLRVIGLGSAILALTASALVPAVTWIEQGSYYRDDVYEMETGLLCVPAGAMVVLAPLFFAVLFSFLQKRKESDFFHAIPYTRTCVYVSFVTAALVFIWAIQLACGVTAGVFWGMIPRVTADIVGMFAYVGISMLAAAMLSAFMMLALTVSGTGGSCSLLFLLFTGFVRVVCAIFLGCMETVYLIDTYEMWNTSILSPLWLLPVNVIYYWGDTETSVALLYSLSNILYSLLATAGLFAFAGLLYNRRHSEMAGNPAPGVRTQALFRIMFTSLGALLVPLLLVNGGDASILLVLVVGVLLVYFLYELVTTKRPKNLLKIMPGLGIVAGVCVAFLLAYGAYYNVVTSESVSPSEIKWVSVESNGFSGGSYQDRLTDTLRTDDAELLKTIADRLAVSQQYERDGMANEAPDYYNRMDVTIRLKNGRALHRRVVMNNESRETVRTRFSALEEVKEIMYLLPADGEIHYGSATMADHGYCYFGDLDQLRSLVDTFRAEFEALTEEQKAVVMAPVLSDSSYYDRYGDDTYGVDVKEEYDQALHNGVILNLGGYVSGQRFNNEYVITDAMPETRRVLTYLMGAELLESCYYHVGDEGLGGSLGDVLAAFGEDAADGSFTETFSYLKGNIVLMGLSSDAEGEMTDTSFILEAEDYPRFVELMTNACAIADETKEQEFTLADGTCYLRLYTDMNDKYTRFDLNVTGIFRFTPAQLEELMGMLEKEK